MRHCGNCNKEDSPWYDGTPCSCGLPQRDEPALPQEHVQDCKALAHNVVLYPVRVATTDLTYDANGEAQLRSAQYLRRGWKLLRNGMRWYRVKYLCRECIELEEAARERRRDYEKACKAVKGVDETTYSQMLASQ